MTSSSEALTAPQPAEFYELLSHIERRPGMYLGSDDLLALENYLSGYDAACKAHGRPQLLVGQEFARWLRAHKPLPVGGEANGPFGLIKLNSPDPLTAWTRFFEYFREYHAAVTTQKQP